MDDALVITEVDEVADEGETALNRSRLLACGHAAHTTHATHTTGAKRGSGGLRLLINGSVLEHPVTVGLVDPVEDAGVIAHQDQLVANGDVGVDHVGRGVLPLLLTRLGVDTVHGLPYGEDEELTVDGRRRRRPGLVSRHEAPLQLQRREQLVAGVAGTQIAASRTHPRSGKRAANQDQQSQAY